MGAGPSRVRPAAQCHGVAARLSFGPDPGVRWVGEFAMGMRITLMCTDLGIRMPGTKGASIHLAAIAGALADQGHAVQLIAVAGRDDPRELRRRMAELRSRMAEVILLPHPGRSTGVERERRKLAFTDDVLATVADAVTAFAPDVIYERLALFGTAGHRLAERLGVPHVVEVNALLAHEEAIWRGLHHCAEAMSREHQVLRSAALRLPVSEELAHSVRTIAGDGRTEVVANGVDPSLFTGLPTRTDA